MILLNFKIRSMFQNKKQKSKALKSKVKGNIEYRKDSNKPSIYKNKRLNIGIVIGSVLFIIGLIGILVLIVLNILNINKEKDVIKIEGVNSENVNDLTKQLIYVSGEGLSSDYYSPSLNLIFKYPSDKFSVTEGVDRIYISPKMQYNTGSYLMIYEKDNADITQKFISKYQKLYDNLEVLKNEKDENGIVVIELKYQTESYLKDKEMDEIYRKIIIREVESKYVIVDINETNGQNTIDAYFEEYKKILKSVDLNPENIEPNITVYVSVPKATIDFNKLKWNINTQNETSFSISFRSHDYEENEDLKDSTTSFSLSSYNLPGGKSEEALALLATNELKYVKENYEDRKFEVLNELEKIEIDGNTFYLIQYKYSNILDKTVIITNYYGYNTDASAMIYIIIQYPDEESIGQVEVSNLVSDLKFNDESLSDLPQTGTSIEIEKATLLGKPSVVHIFNRSCVDLKFESSSGLIYAYGKTYELCSAGLGSGFFINKDGYIITNAHVAAYNSIDIAIDGLLIGYDPGDLYDALYKDIISYFIQQYPDLTIDNEVMKQIEYAMIIMIVEGNKEGYVSITNPRYENYVQTDTPYDFDIYKYDLKDKSKYLETEIVAKRDIQSFYEKLYEQEVEKKEVGFTIPDLALIKIKNINSQVYPTLKIIDQNNVSGGMSIFVIGFPGTAENKMIFSEESTIIPTITKGTISAVKPSYQNAYDLVQIDASISNGNSGGPIISNNGEVVGVATYGLSLEESADFNAGVSIEEVVKLLDENNISNDLGDITNSINSGIDDLGSEYYKWAIEDFEKAKSINSKLSDLLDPLINIAKEKIDKGEDKTPVLVIGGINIEKNELVIFICVVVCIVLGLTILVILTILKKISKRKESRILKEGIQTDIRYNQPIQPSQVQNYPSVQSVPNKQNTQVPNSNTYSQTTNNQNIDNTQVSGEINDSKDIQNPIIKPESNVNSNIQVNQQTVNTNEPGIIQNKNQSSISNSNSSPQQGVQPNNQLNNDQNQPNTPLSP